MTEEHKPSEETKNSADPQFDICPCCGKPTLTRPIKPSQLLMDHWLSCMISCTPFNHMYSLYDGRVEITVSMPSAETEDLLFRITQLVDALARQDALMSEQPLDMAHLRARIRMCALISQIRIRTSVGDWKEFRPVDALRLLENKLNPMRESILTGEASDELKGLLNEIKAILTSPQLLSSLPLDVLATTAEAHVQLNNIMMNAGFDKNFWSGIELA